MTTTSAFYIIIIEIKFIGKGYGHMEIKREHVDYEMVSKLTYKDPTDSDFHWHENMEIVNLVDEPGRFLVDGKIIDANPGDIIVIKDQSVHRFMLEKFTWVRIIQFRIKILLNREIAIKAIRSHIKAEEIDEIPGLREKFNNLFALMDKEGHAVNALDNMFFQYLTVALYILLMKHFAEDETYNSSKRDRKEFYRITEFINEHFREEINATIIGQKLFISRSYATMLFLKFSGIGLNEYIRSLRVKYANQLMMDGVSVTQAALESGFQCVRTFNNAYKAEMGTTPTEYMKQINKQKKEDK